MYWTAILEEWSSLGNPIPLDAACMEQGQYTKLFAEARAFTQLDPVELLR